MPKNVYSLGLDFGTQSARYVLLDAETGRVAAQGHEAYPTSQDYAAHSEGYRTGWATRPPRDFQTTLGGLLETACQEAARQNADVVGIGLCSTACSVLPCRADGAPLTRLDAFRDHPHAQVKLWKHLTADEWADKIILSGASFLKPYGGSASPEWALPKALETMTRAPDVWESTERWIDVGDWLTWQLTGEEVRSAAIAGYKYFWSAQASSYPSSTDLARIHPNAPSWLEKLQDPLSSGSAAGVLRQPLAQSLGLSCIPVAVAGIDAHAGFKGLSIDRPNVLALILGTSSVQLVASKSYDPRPGIFGAVKDGLLEDHYGYEAGQAAVGDMLDWWTRMIAGGSRSDATEAQTEWSRERVGAQREVVALDWWNGSRTPRVDPLARGVLAGLSLTTTPAHVYQALVTSAACGARQIVEFLESITGRMESVRVTGGLANVDFILQRYADVLMRPLEVAVELNSSAVGAALNGAAAAGVHIQLAPAFTVVRPARADGDDDYARYLDLQRQIQAENSS